VAVFELHRGFYGAPRIHQKLRITGRFVGRDCVARLMRRAELKAKPCRGFRHCQNAGNRSSSVVEKLLQQEFAPPEQNRW
jgi:putative transposase